MVLVKRVANIKMQKAGAENLVYAKHPARF